MKYSIPFLFLLLLGWIFLGGFWQNSVCCFAGPPLSIKDGATGVAYHANNLIFGRSGNALDLSGAGVKPEVGKLAAYLKKNPSKAVTLTGKYASDEKNTTSFENLGFGRADALKKYLVGLGVPAAQVLTASSLTKGLSFDDNNKLYGGMGYAFSEIAGGRSISIKDAAAFSAGTNDNFLFAQSGFEHKAPVSAKLKAELGKTAEYLKKNGNRSLKITGLYGKDEKNGSILKTLGHARANNIKGYLTSLGAPSNQIDIDARILPTIAFTDAKELVGGADYTFYDTPTTNDRLAEVEKRLKAKPLILYFATNSENITLNEQQRAYFSDLIYYLDNKTGAKAFATGHTDNRGDDSQNRRLGRKRAEFVQSYLAKNGISTAKTQAVSKGPDQPVDTNETPEGRQKNRRVEITVN